MDKNSLILCLKTPSRTSTLEVSRRPHASYADYARDLAHEFDGQVILAKTGQVLHELSEAVDPDLEAFTLLDTADTDGHRVYMRSLSFIFILAINRTFPKARAVVEHSISGGAYCTIRQGSRRMDLDSHTRDRIQEEMARIVEADMAIERQLYSVPEAIEFFKEIGRQDKADLLHYLNADHVAIYRLGDYYDSFYGYMAPSTGYISTFRLELFEHGLVLLGPERDQRGVHRNFTPQYKLSETYREAERWSELQKIEDVYDLNQLLDQGKIGEVVRMTEGLQQHKIMEIGQEIIRRNKRIILIAAPSSSGKTSFAYKLMNDLRVLGLRPLKISMDDYYVDRDKTPLDADGQPDFESIYAIDLDRFEKDMDRLLHGQSVAKVLFDFLSGKSITLEETLSLSEGDPIIIEGIHGLNPLLLKNLDDRLKFRIYLSVTTQINLDDHNRIHTTDLRLMRRMARDKASRGRSVRDTIMDWPSVRAGEKRNIFPYQEEADILFNSSFIYEIAALKFIIEEDLRAIPPEDPAYLEAGRLLALLKYFLPMEDISDVVNTSILREFIGGSKIV